MWIGNWGDEGRTAEIEEFLLEPRRFTPGRDYLVARNGQEMKRLLREGTKGTKGTKKNNNKNVPGSDAAWASDLFVSLVPSW